MVPPEVQEELAQLRSRVAEGEEWQRKREAEVDGSYATLCMPETQRTETADPYCDKYRSK